jgi:hypothetical protein
MSHSRSPSDPGPPKMLPGMEGLLLIWLVFLLNQDLLQFFCYIFMVQVNWFIGTGYLYIVNWFNPLLHEQFCEKLLFLLKMLLLCTCYKFKLLETVKDASIFIRLRTNVDWTIAFVTASSILNFPLQWQQGDISKLSKVTILHSKLISKCCNF